MSTTEVLKKLEKWTLDERVHFIIQSLNGYSIERYKLNEKASNFCHELEESNILIIDEGPILKNDIVILLTVPEITYADQKTFIEVPLSGLEHQFNLIDDLGLSKNIISVFRIELAS